MNLSQDEILQLLKDLNIEAIQIPHSEDEIGKSHTEWLFELPKLLAFANAIQSHSGGEAVGWQFLDEGKWHQGSNLNNHKQNTIDGGYEVRDLFTYQPDQSARIEELEKLLGLLEYDVNHERRCYKNLVSLHTELTATNTKLVEQVRVMRDALAEIKLETGDTLSFTVADKALLKAGD